MRPTAASESPKAIAGVAALLPHLEAVYKDIHAHPELSLQ